MYTATSITGDETILSIDNMSFDGTERGGKMTTNGQLWIGSTASPHVKLGSLTSPSGTVTIGYSGPNITLDVTGGLQPIEQFTVDTFTGAGTNPVFPTVAGLITITAGQYATGSFGTRVMTIVSQSVNQYAVLAQISSAVASTNMNKNGLSHFDSSLFTVDANGFVSASTTGFLKTLTGTTGGALPPTANNINILASVVAAGTTPIAVAGAGSTLTINPQTSSAVGASAANKNGLSHFDSSRFTVDANGFVSINGSGLGETITGQSGGALSPTAGNWNISGASTAAGTSPVVTSGSVSTLTVNVQKSQAIASTDATKIGLSAFNSVQFSVDANGFVSTVSTPIVWSVITADQTAVINNGYICNKGSALLLTLPATASIGDRIRVTGINTALGWKIVQNANQQIFFGTSSTTLGAGGYLQSFATRDTVELLCVVAGASTVYNVLSSIGNITVV